VGKQKDKQKQTKEKELAAMLTALGL